MPKTLNQAQTSVQRNYLSIVLFSGVYIYFLFALFLPFAKWWPDVLRSLTVSDELIRFEPRNYTILVYFFGLLGVVCGYFFSVKFLPVLAPPESQYAPNKKMNRIMAVVIAAISGCSFLAQVWLSKGFPVFALQERWIMNAKLVLGVALIIPVVAGLFAVFGITRKTLFGFVLVLLVTAALGTRSMPMSLVFAVLFAYFLYAKFKDAVKILGFGLTLGLVVVVVLGAFTKTVIYDPHASEIDFRRGFSLLQSDAIGTFYNLDSVISAVDNPAIGNTKGKMFIDTALNMVPGYTRDYANFQIGKLLHGRESVTVGGVEIERSVSLTATFVGAPYADGGVCDVIAVSFLLGLFMAQFEGVAMRVRWFSGYYGFYLAHMVSAIYGGIYNHMLFSATIMCFLGIVYIYITNVRNSYKLENQLVAVK
ncbi:MAG: hypothetical protein Q4A71_03845 [Actinomycetaceae bacterium]|nr:hypothetical protein [Actinomycetaceae bacterium]